MAKSPALIPRRVLFGNPDHDVPSISPDGRFLSWIAPVGSALNLWVAPVDHPEEGRPVTGDPRGIRGYRWSFFPGMLLYYWDVEGDENWHISRVDLDHGTDLDLTPWPRTAANLVRVSAQFPGEVLIAMNDREPKWHDLYRVDLATGTRTLVERNDSFSGYRADDDFVVRFAVRTLPDASVEYLEPGPDRWRLWDSVPFEDTKTTWVAGFGPGRIVYLLDSRNRNTSALVELDPDTGSRRILVEDPRCDVQDWDCHPTTKRILAAMLIHERAEWIALDPEWKAHHDRLRQSCPGVIHVRGRTQDDKTWVVSALVDQGATRYYLYDTGSFEVRFLFTSQSALEGLSLVPMQSSSIRSRDGLELLVYYSVPNQAQGPVPLVLLPHGGPWGRDYWGFNSQHQWLANRGYAALSVNFRSSTGLGKDFINAGDGEWGGKILEDQLDAVAWAVAQGFADPARVAVMGASFGGYSVLAGLAFHPEVFVCGIDLVGPSNLLTLLETVPEYWKPVLEMLYRGAGDPRTPEGREQLVRYSPLTKAADIRAPLLIGQGANDPRVKRAESDQIVEALKAHQIPVVYAIYPDEGHGFVRPENHISFMALAEAFLARSLGGAAEAPGSDFDGASVEIVCGQEFLPVLS